MDWIRGFAMGMAIAAPVGPIGVLCMRKTIAEGRWAGFICGLGAATADGVYGAAAAFGMATALAGVNMGLLQVAGGAALVAVGTLIARARPREATASAGRAGVVRGYATTFLLTLANPMTIITFAAVIAAQPVESTSSVLAERLVFVAGVFAGSAAWWLILSVAVGYVRHSFTPARMRWVNRICGATLIVFGAWAVLSYLFVA